MKRKQQSGHSFGTFEGVYTPAILTIIGVVMYLRFGWVLGNAGLAGTLAIVTLSTAITFLTSLSISTLATNMRMGGGGAYYMVSRSLGAETGVAVGVPLFLSQAIGIAFYTAGFTEAFVNAFDFASGWDPRVAGTVALAALTALSFFSANLALKAQFAIMAAIAVSLVSFFAGGPPQDVPAAMPAADAGANLGFWTVLAVFFPAVTGILSGVGMSGDLKNPSRSIPLGTIAAVLTGYAVYMAVPLALHSFAGGSPALKTDPMLFQKCSAWAPAVLAGVWAASLSSALGSLLAAPRVLQALAQDRAAPGIFARGWGAANEPRAAVALVFAIAAAALWMGDINAIAPVLTMFNLTVYGLLNLCAGAEELMDNPSWRPGFRVPWYLPAAGCFGCFAMMFMIDAGATFAAAACVLAIFLWARKRKMRSGWNDIRRGLRMYGVRSLLLKLDRRRADERNWRPNLLVFGGAGESERHLVGLAGSISRNRGFLTFAHVIPVRAWTARRAAEMADAMRSHLRDEGVEAFVRVHPHDSPWDGMCELVKTFGFGPLSPNTLLAGCPQSPAACAGLAAAAKLAAAKGMNLVFPLDPQGVLPPPQERVIDVWWRGGSGNAPFMLALATLVRGCREWRRAKLRLCRILSPSEKRENVEQAMNAFVAESRVDAEAEICEPPPGGMEETAQSVSGESSLVFFGLRPPEPGEPPEAWGAHLMEVGRRARGCRRAILALACEPVDFRAIFR